MRVGEYSRGVQLSFGDSVKGWSHTRDLYLEPKKNKTCGYRALRAVKKSFTKKIKSQLKALNTGLKLLKKNKKEFP